MNSSSQDTEDGRLALQSRLSEIARVPPWIESLGSLYAIPERTRFAMELCLEEAISNIIRHGYVEREGAIVVRYFANRDGFFRLIIEDNAPLFNPGAVKDRPLPTSLEEMAAGGQGLRLLKQFANGLEYEATPTGNRLTIRFVSPESSAT